MFGADPDGPTQWGVAKQNLYGMGIPFVQETARNSISQCLHPLAFHQKIIHEQQCRCLLLSEEALIGIYITNEKKKNSMKMEKFFLTVQKQKAAKVIELVHSSILM